MHRLLKGGHSWVAGEARQPWRQCCHRLRTPVRRTQSSLCPSDIEWVKSRISGMRKALLRIHQGQRGPAGVRLLVPQLHNDQLPTGRHRGNRTNRFSKSSFIVSLFSKDFCLFARIYNIKTNVSEMLICCCEREAAFLNWISALVTSLWHFKCCIVHNKGLKGWSLGWCWWCLHQVNYLYLDRSLAWGLSS